MHTCEYIKIYSYIYIPVNMTPSTITINICVIISASFQVFTYCIPFALICMFSREGLFLDIFSIIIYRECNISLIVQ